ncbi:MAG: hypothetical protein R3A13_05675 [Bdellovibrionota bacterium]
MPYALQVVYQSGVYEKYTKDNIDVIVCSARHLLSLPRINTDEKHKIMAQSKVAILSIGSRNSGRQDFKY